jgi:nucleotide-binding universal stress UspA family protein
MFRRILAPVDGSSFSEQGLPYAAHAARGADAELDLLFVHVRYAPVSAEMTIIDEIEEWEVQQKQQEAQYMDTLAARMTHDYGVRARAHTVDGAVVTAVEWAVREWDSDLVVLTTHGRAGLERAWLGSVADSLLRHLDVPVLLIRPKDADAEPGDAARVEYRHVVIALDGGELAERALEPALALAGPTASLTLLRVVTPPSSISSPYLPHAARLTKQETERREAEARAYVDRVAERLTAAGQVADGVVVSGAHEASAILEYARTENADLIALTTHGRGPVTRLLMGSVTDKVVRAAEVPVLVC